MDTFITTFTVGHSTNSSLKCGKKDIFEIILSCMQSQGMSFTVSRLPKGVCMCWITLIIIILSRIDTTASMFTVGHIYLLTV